MPALPGLDGHGEFAIGVACCCVVSEACLGCQQSPRATASATLIPSTPAESIPPA